MGKCSFSERNARIKSQSEIAYATLQQCVFVSQSSGQVLKAHMQRKSHLFGLEMGRYKNPY